MQTDSMPGQLREIVFASAWLMHVLEALRLVAPEGAYIGAGAVRSVVWDALHGFATRSAVPDVDVVYFDADDVRSEREAAMQDALFALAPDVAWEVTNQAGVHLWYEQAFGRPVDPCGSLQEGIATWPETATAIAVRLAPDGQLDIIAPFGLADLMGMTVRHNPERASVAQYAARIEQKRYQERWPKVVVVPA